MLKESMENNKNEAQELCAKIFREDRNLIGFSYSWTFGDRSLTLSCTDHKRKKSNDKKCSQ